MQRIDPATIFIGGMPLVGKEQTDFRVALNGIISRVAIPFFQLFATLEEPVGSGLLQPFPAYDPAVNGTNVVLWEALRDHVAMLGLLDAPAVRVEGGRPHTRDPDLAFNPVDVVLPASAQGGAAFNLTVPVINLGGTGVQQFQLDFSMDTTPADFTDNPDGFTDGVTGLAFQSLGSVAGGAVPGQLAGQEGQLMVPATLNLPAGLEPGSYPIFIDITGVVSADPLLPETVTANNGGVRFPVTLTVN